MRRLLVLLAVTLSLDPVPARAEATPDTLAGVVPQPVVEVSTSRVGERTPQAASRLKREDLLKLDWGQDTPMALATQPGAFAYSDAGNGIGYSYLTLRGFPQRRISVLVNGVPLNDPESHEVYWIDHPDLLASTVEAQVQRGVGSALYGAASVGGSVNLGIVGAAVEAVDLGYRVVVPRDGVIGHPTDYTELVLEHTLALLARLTTVDELLAEWR